MSKPLSTFKKQAAEEKKKTTAPTPAATETEATETEETEDEGETDDEGESETEETETESTETEGSKKADVSTGKSKPAKGAKAKVESGKPVALQPGEVAIKATDLKKIQADAKAWNDNKATFATLQDWHNSVKGNAANVPGQADRSEGEDNSASSKVAGKSWNQKAQQSYNKGKKS